MNRKHFILSIFAFLFAGWYFLIREESSHDRPAPKNLAKPLESYRSEFKRPDGSLPSDAQLEEALRAKGIPYQAASSCEPGKVCPGLTSKSLAHIPEIEFQNSGLSLLQKNEVRNTLADVLSAQMAELYRVEPNVKLRRIVVDSRKFVQLHFNKDFMTIAREENRLNDFSEGLNSAGLAGLKGLNIYIDGKTLGEVMQEIDQRNNEDASSREQERQPSDTLGTK
jgi:hypothetical protein